MAPKRYRLLGPNGFCLSDTPGQLGGNSKAKIFGRLDFADETAAISAGFRPCGTCLRDEYIAWKNLQQTGTEPPQGPGVD